ncbi:MAG: sulfotransferase domain-containing protein [Caldilineaceae bacterium]|nr:sulfotransferase domain-containing protein [Caldilineaceae bacterium]
MTTIQTLTRPASLSEYHERLQKMQDPLMAESTRRGLMYQPQPSDLFITPFAKCGTTWLQQIVHGLRTRGDMDFDDISRVIPWLEMAHRQELDLYGPATRRLSGVQMPPQLAQDPQRGTLSCLLP